MSWHSRCNEIMTVKFQVRPDRSLTLSVYDGEQAFIFGDRAACTAAGLRGSWNVLF